MSYVACLMTFHGDTIPYLAPATKTIMYSHNRH